MACALWLRSAFSIIDNRNNMHQKSLNQSSKSSIQKYTFDSLNSFYCRPRRSTINLCSKKLEVVLWRHEGLLTTWIKFSHKKKELNSLRKRSWRTFKIIVRYNAYKYYINDVNIFLIQLLTRRLTITYLLF